jgi:hypothetical protein
MHAGEVAKDAASQAADEFGVARLADGGVGHAHNLISFSV